MSATALSIQQRRARVEELWLEGKSLKDMAIIFGCSDRIIKKDLALIRERMEQDNKYKIAQKRWRAVARKEKLLSTTLEAFKRSQKPEEEVTTKYEPHKCEPCSGRGTVDEEECPACEGKGKQLVEVVTRKIKGQAGDSAFLNVAARILSDIDKIEGTIIRKQAVKVKGKVAHGHLHASLDEDKLRAIPDDDLLELRKLHHRLLSPSALAEQEEQDEIIEVPDDGLDDEDEDDG